MEITTVREHIEGLSSYKEMLQAMADAGREGTMERFAALQEAYHRMQHAESAGETFGFDPSVVLSDEELDSAVLEELRELNYDLTGAVRRHARSLRRSPYAFRMRAIRLTDTGAVEMPLLTRDRLCMAGVLALVAGVDIYAERLVSYFPTSDDTSEELIHRLSLPEPRTEDDLRLIAEVGLAVWQCAEIRRREAEYARANGLLPVTTTPETASAYRGVNHCATIFMRRDTVMSIIKDVSEIHYLGGLFTNLNSVMRGRAIPEVDYVHYESLTRFEANVLSQIMGFGPMMHEDGRTISDGRGFYVLRDYTVDELADRMRFVYGGTDEKLFNRYVRARWHARAHDAQIRAAVVEEGRVCALAKGVTTAVWFETLEAAVLRFVDKMNEREKALESLRGTSSYEEALVDWQAYASVYEPILERLIAVVERGEDTVFLVRGDQLKVDHAAPSGRCFLGFTPLKGKDPARVEEETLQAEIVEGEHVAHLVFHGKTHAHKPTVFRPRMNSQVTMFFDYRSMRAMVHLMNKRLGALAEMLRTPQGIARLVSEREAEERARLEESWLSPGAVTESSHEDLDLMRQALRSGLLRMSTSDMILMSRGEQPEGPVQTLRSVKARIDALATSALKDILSTFGGGRWYGYLLQTCDNSLTLCRRLWAIERTSEGDEDTMGFAAPVPAADPSHAPIPHAVTERLGGDDDGDIYLAIASVVILEGRAVKACALVRFPNLDPVAVWLLPASVPTPWDARTDEEDDIFRQTIEIFAPRIPENADLYSDGIVMAELPYSIFLSDKSARASIAKRKIRGEVTEASAWKLIRRKQELNTTGSLTRRLEKQLARITTFRQRRLTAASEREADMWLESEEALAREALATKLAIEANLISFKYETDSSRKGRMFVPGDGLDPDGITSDREVHEMLPLDYHKNIGRLHAVLDTFIFEHDKYSSLESTTAFEPHDTAVFDAEGQVLPHKESAVLNIVRASGCMEVLEAMRKISEDPAPFARILADRVRRAFGTTVLDEMPAETQQRVYALLNAFAHWTRSWKEVMRDRDALMQALDPEDPRKTLRLVRSVLSLAGKALRAAVRTTAEMLTLDELAAAIYAYLGTENPSMAAISAALDVRAGELFPEGGRVIHVTQGKRHEIRVFSSGRDLYGVLGEDLPGTLTYVEEKGLFILAHGDEEPYVLRIGDGNKTPMPEAHDALSIQRVSARMAVIRF